MNGVANGVFTGDTLLGLNNAPWVDWSEQAIITGWSSFTTKRILYKINGNMIFLHIALQGTSNSTSTNFTLPFTSRFSQHASLGYIVDNGASLMSGLAEISGITNSLVFWKPSTTGNVTITSTWTGSGTKGIFGDIFFIL